MGSLYLLSAVQRPAVLAERILAFVQDFYQQLCELPAEKFASHVVALASRWLEPKRTLSEVQSSCWGEIVDGHPIFDREERETAILGTVTLQEVCNLYKLHLLQDSQQRACVVTAVAPFADDFSQEVEKLGKISCRTQGACTIINTEKDFHA